jgi:hypothetical protein
MLLKLRRGMEARGHFRLNAKAKDDPDSLMMSRR